MRRAPKNLLEQWGLGKRAGVFAELVVDAVSDLAFVLDSDLDEQQIPTPLALPRPPDKSRARSNVANSERDVSLRGRTVAGKLGRLQREISLKKCIRLV